MMSMKPSIIIVKFIAQGLGGAGPKVGPNGHIVKMY